MCRILVIDDEGDVRAAIQRRLQREGYEVDAASGSEEGIRLIQRSEPPYDVVITDMSMEDPEAGLKVLSAAFAKDILAEVIVLTAYGNVANAVECMRRGAFDYIEKNNPGVDSYELLAIKVQQASERRRNDIRAIEKWQRVATAVQGPGS